MTDLWLPLTRIVIILFTLSLAWLTYRSHQLLQQFRPPFNVLLSPPENGSRVMLVVWCLFLAWCSGLSAQTLGFVSSQPLNSVLWGVGVGVITQIGLNLVTYVAIRLFGAQIYSTWLILNILPTRPSEWVGVALAFGPAVGMEELLFRSLLLGGLQNIVPWPVLIGVTSLIFGLMHLPQGQLGVIAAASINILLSGLFFWSGEFWVCFVAHYTINLLQVILAYHQQDWLKQLGENS